MVADALSRKSFFAVRAMNTQLSVIEYGSILVELRPRPMFLQEICNAQKSDKDLQAKMTQCETFDRSDVQISTDSCLMFQDRVCVPRDDELIGKILLKAHNSCISIHLGSTKMYNDLKRLY
ncbi:uncharacterized protein LOC108488109 [Gossypium arboreum]|uniref:uncharacterized protein LOC108488109 n=1 Tax=Gossypium arboreum TaxID=29729 RepID=UPI0008193099|nr:uncharacterized protein LOC108488109 [Gossypium arboreum]